MRAFVVRPGLSDPLVPRSLDAAAVPLFGGKPASCASAKNPDSDDMEACRRIRVPKPTIAAALPLVLARRDRMGHDGRSGRGVARHHHGAHTQRMKFRDQRRRRPQR